MTPAEIDEEVCYRTDERLGMMGFYDPKTTPAWAIDQASNEARAAISKLNKTNFPTQPVVGTDR